MSAHADVTTNVTECDDWSIVKSTKKEKRPAIAGESRSNQRSAFSNSNGSNQHVVKKPDVYLNLKLVKLDNTSCSKISGRVYHFILDLVKRESDMNVINTVRMIGFSPNDKLLCLTMLFQICVRQDKASMMQRIIDSVSKSDRLFMVNAFDRKYTPLMQAAYNGSVSSVKLLLIWGANIDEINIDGEDVYSATIAGKDSQIKKTPLLEIFLIPKFQEIHNYLKSWQDTENDPDDRQAIEAVSVDNEAVIIDNEAVEGSVKLILEHEDITEQIKELLQSYIDDYNTCRLTMLFEEINQLIASNKITKDSVKSIVKIHQEILQDEFTNEFATLRLS
jgi:hypothetical protein